jgi:hypothetical protein
MEKTTFNYLIFHIEKLINVRTINEIRHIRVLRKSKVNKEISIFKLLFLSNDFVGFKKSGIREDTLNYFIIKTANELYVCGLENTFEDNGLKTEKVIKFQKVNKFISAILSSKYDRIVYP